MNRSLRHAATLVALSTCVSCAFDSDSSPELETQSFAATIPTGFVEQQIASNIAGPTAMQFAPDGRLFVCQQTGALRVIKNGTLLTAPFVTLSVDSSGERGLLGIAFDPQFATNNFVYVYYTVRAAPVHNRLSRFTASGDVAAAGSEKIILELPTLSDATNHNGGAINFGADGRLYIAVGDNAKGTNASSLSSMFGKILRINSDGTIPTDNPFYNSTTGNNRAIWALGLRNPFTFGFHPTSGRMFVNDVGQDSWEEVNEGARGANYGWPTTEGYTTNTAYRSPLYAYSHSTGGCSVVGAAFYAPKTTVTFPSGYVGDYFFADYCSGWIKYIDLNAGNAVKDFASGIKSPIDLEVGPDGGLYYLTRGASGVFRIQYTASQAPVIATQPVSQTVPAGMSTSFTCTASGTAPITYQWQRNGATITGATATTYTFTPTTADNGATYRCRAANSYGVVYSTSARLTVVPSQPPVATITTPANGATYAAGDSIAYSGTGTDNEDGTLPASAFTWRVDFHHDEHTHPFIPDTSGMTGGTMTIPTTGHTESNVWYRLHLTVVDSTGLKATVSRDIRPRTAQMTFQTAPTGLEVLLDGQPRVTPFTITGVVGVERTLGVETPQVLGGTSYTFSRWSDGGAATHDIATPSAATTYTATFNGGTPPRNGVRAEYFDNMDFTASRLTLTEATIAHRWDYGSPHSTIAPDTFSARWTGRVQPQYSQTYTFYLVSDQAARLWVNGQLLVDAWTQHTEREDRGTIALTAGQLYDIRVDYFENAGPAVLKLSWSSPSVTKQYVPAARLFAP